MPTDLEIAQTAMLRPITELARERLGLAEDQLRSHGPHVAKIALPALQALSPRPDGRLVLVTAISPTPAGEGKTTTSIGLADGFSRIGQRAIVALREPSLGPVFGMKGGAAGGGRAQVLPMEDINLHFTGDFHAIAMAHNLLAAALDNHLHHGNALRLDVRRITWKRVLDMNDRALRQITLGLGGPAHGVPRESGFDIVVASEVMAIVCLATSVADLKRRLGGIVVGESVDGRRITAADLKVSGAMAVLLKDAIAPNLVQTLEGTPALLHGGPFANIAHGCSSVMATQAALKLADVVVTEAGFGADLGAEKFIHIKCRAAGLAPSAAVLVATLRALKYHGGLELGELAGEHLPALERGLANLERHLQLLREGFGLPCVVALNHRVGDEPAEIERLQRFGAECGVKVVLARHWAEGGAGAEELAREVLAAMEAAPAPRLRPLYEPELPLWDKLLTLARRVHHAEGVSATPAQRRQLERWQAEGFGQLPVCIAKTPYSFSADPALRGAASGHTLPLRELRLNAGAGFVVAICGDVLTMPGLPKVPAAEGMDLTDEGRVVGLD